MWKRYGITIVFCVIILVSLVVFYSNVETIAQENKTLQLKTLSGDDDVVENVHVKGRVDINRKPMMVDISNKKTTYSELLTKRFNSHETVTMPYHAKIHEFQQEYRSFMRGKQMIDSFYEDDRQLVYAYIPYDETAFENDFSELNIDFYDKKSKDTSQVKVSLPEELKVGNGYMEVLEVQMSNSQIILLLDVYKGGHQSIYYVTVQGGEVVDSHLLLEVLPKEDANLNSVTTLMNERRIANSDYFLFKKNQWNEQSGSSTTALYAVDLVSAEVKEVSIPNVTLGEENFFYDGDQMFYHVKDELWQLDLDDLQAKMISNELKVEYFDGMKINDGKLYVLGTKSEHQRQLIIFDLNQNKEIYRGEINTKPFKDILFIELYDVVLPSA